MFLNKIVLSVLTSILNDFRQKFVSYFLKDVTRIYKEYWSLRIRFDQYQVWFLSLQFI